MLHFCISCKQLVCLMHVSVTRLQVLLHKYSAQEELVVGTPYANRDLSEVHGLMGPFINTLALRLDAGGDPTFSEALQRAKGVAAQAFVHGSAPFAKVVGALDIIRSAAFTPVYQVRQNIWRQLQSVPQRPAAPTATSGPGCAEIAYLHVLCAGHSQHLQPREQRRWRLGWTAC
jgi:non-ribosomal peptide synthetase component F